MMVSVQERFLYGFWEEKFLLLLKFVSITPKPFSPENVSDYLRINGSRRSSGVRPPWIHRRFELICSSLWSDAMRFYCVRVAEETLNHWTSYTPVTSRTRGEGGDYCYRFFFHGRLLIEEGENGDVHGHSNQDIFGLGRTYKLIKTKKAQLWTWQHIWNCFSPDFKYKPMVGQTQICWVGPEANKIITGPVSNWASKFNMDWTGLELDQ